MKISAALEGATSLLLDTAPVIYHLERNPRYASVLDEFFRVRKQNGILLVTTPVTLAETLVHPIRQGLTDLQAQYQRLIVGGENTLFLSIGAPEAACAARLRAEHRLRLADSLQAAVALEAGCGGILTNDSAFKRLSQIRVLILEELEA